MALTDSGNKGIIECLTIIQDLVRGHDLVLLLGKALYAGTYGEPEDSGKWEHFACTARIY